MIKDSLELRGGKQTPGEAADLTQHSALPGLLADDRLGGLDHSEVHSAGLESLLRPGPPWGSPGPSLCRHVDRHLFKMQLTA